MNSEKIIESGMTFGSFPVGNYFHIEKSKTYANIQDNVKIAEFLLLRHKQGSPVVWIIEAKSSSPRPETKQNFDDFINEISNKLVNAFSLGVASILKRHTFAENELSPQFKGLDLVETGFKFVLIINGHREEWLAPLLDALNNVLQPTIKTWALDPMAVAVLNENGARKFGLVK